MPLDGSDVASKPAGTTAVAQTPVESAKFNSVIDDIYAIFNSVRSIAKGFTGANTAVGAHDNLSTKGANVASAATTDIGAATGQFIHITGTVGITALGTKTAGVVRRVVFDGALKLTHHATSLILPGAVDIYTAANDTAELVSEGGGNWRMLWFQRASAAPADGRHATCEGRLTLTTGVAVTTSDVTAAGTVYFTPFKGNKVWLYNGTSGWSPYTFTERSIALSGGSASKPHDLFLYDNAGTLTLDLVAWTDDTTRATTLALQDGILVKSGATARRYLGTIYSDGSKQCEDSLAKRNVWNVVNRVLRSMKVLEATNSWTYTTNNYRQARASTANQLEMVRGLDEDMAEAEVMVSYGNSSAGPNGIAAIGVDVTNAMSADCINGIASVPVTTYTTYVLAKYKGRPGIGRHILTWLERSTATGTGTWYGDNGGTEFQSGIMGAVWA